MIGQAHPYTDMIFQIECRLITITSDLVEPCSSKPPVTLILPPTTEARGAVNGLGREARGVQTVASGRRVSTEER